MAVITRLERKSRRWEQVWQSDAEAVASIVAGRLEAEGIRTRIHGFSTPYRTAALNLGGAWGIAVPAGKAGHARDLLEEFGEGHNVIEHVSESGLTGEQAATIRFVVVLLAVTGVVLALAAVLGRT